MRIEDHDITISPAYASVWDAIMDTPAEAANMRMRSDVMVALIRRIEEQNWTQAEAARIMGVTQPRVSDLIRGKIQRFGLDALVAMATAAGLAVEVRVREAA